jgi:dolichol kinase
VSQNLVTYMLASCFAKMADLVGRRLGKYTGKWPFSESKSYAGTAAFIVSSTLVGILLCSWFGHFGAFSLELSREEQALRIALISVVAGLIELVEFLDDNWTVPIAAAALTYFLLY